LVMWICTIREINIYLDMIFLMEGEIMTRCANMIVMFSSAPTMLACSNNLSGPAVLCSK